MHRNDAKSESGGHQKGGKAVGRTTPKRAVRPAAVTVAEPEQMRREYQIGRVHLL